ncbi:hypothetical protein [Radicibacter daui]|uniref:hypothetical protein n=1 Tax=Radicibacter daui TaxID=3064829 RepID=UPI004046A349
MRVFRFAVAALFMCLLVSCRAPIYQVSDAEFPAGTEKLSMADIKSVIVQVAAGRDWIVSETAPGKLVLTYSPRDVEAKVEVDFDLKKFSIRYVDSVNLLYDGTEIHRNYNRWVNNLQHDILSGVSVKVASAS